MRRSQIETLIWYFKNPNFFKQLLFLSKRKLWPSAKEKTEADDTKSFLKNLFGGHFKDFNELYPEHIQYAEEKIKNTPIKMGGPGNMTLLYHMVKKLDSKKIIETGVAYGWSSLALLTAIEETDEAKLISTDMPYAKLNNEDFVGVVIPKQLQSKWNLVRLPDIVGLPLALRDLGDIDFCHYDSDKSFIGRMWAYKKIWQSLKAGGYLVSDDIGDNLAFKEFADLVETEPQVILMGNQYIGVLKKSNDSL